MDEEKLISFEGRAGYCFHDRRLLLNALTHSSYANERHLHKNSCNERLEFLGDAVLELTTSEFLFLKHTNMQEGEMTKLRASLVCEQTLAWCARELAIGDYVRMGRGEEATGGRERNSILSDTLEAVIGAIYLDGGFANAKEFIHKFILTDLDRKQLFYDSKTILQEMIQGQFQNQETIRYELVQEMGPDHNKQFEIRVIIRGHEYGRGIGHTKKAAEQEAAYQAILELQKRAEETDGKVLRI